MDTTVSDPMLGRLIDGRYRVQGRLARGGMATVYRALDVRLDRVVALKVMHPGLAEDEAFVARFIREARSAARLTDPGIVAVYDQGDDDGIVFLAMEFVAGGTLRDRIRARGRLSPRESLDLLEPVLTALAAAHRAGIVHRDVKPENVLLGDDGRIKVADFGLARSALSTGASGTTLGVVMGTVAYLAPEQVERGTADPRSDVYSAGILLYEMLTGVPPFTGETPMAVAYQHVNRDVPAPSSVVPGLPPELDRLVLTATARDADRRPPDASEMLRLLRDVRSRIDLDRAAVVSGPANDTVDLTKTLVVPAGAMAGTWAGQGGSAYAPPSGRSSNRGGSVPYVPADLALSVSAGDDPLPPVGRTGMRRRRTWIGLVILLLVALAAGIGAWYLGAGRYTSTPSVLGMSGTAARHKLTTDGFTVTLAPAQYSETVPTGYVISTDPGPGQRIEKHGSVSVVLSRGKLRYKVPNLVNLNVADATKALNSTHLVVGATSQAYSSTIGTGKVVSTSPSAAAEVKSGSAVNLVVSKGLPPVAVPNLVGSSMSNAQSAALAVNLTVVSGGQQSSMTVPKGDIISQSPVPGTQVSQNSVVTVLVSTGPPLVVVPDVVGMSTQDAKKTLQKAGFKVHTYNELPAVLLNTVYTENPGGGSKAPKGSTVSLGIV